jgi:hypothetical protein
LFKTSSACLTCSHSPSCQQPDSHMQLACSHLLVWACVACLLLMPHGVCTRGAFIGVLLRCVGVCAWGQESRGVVGLSGTARVLRLCVAGNTGSILNRCFSTPPNTGKQPCWLQRMPIGSQTCSKPSRQQSSCTELQDRLAGC